MDIFQITLYSATNLRKADNNRLLFANGNDFREWLGKPYTGIPSPQTLVISRPTDPDADGWAYFSLEQRKIILNLPRGTSYSNIDYMECKTGGIYGDYYFYFFVNRITSIPNDSIDVSPVVVEFEPDAFHTLWYGMGLHSPKFNLVELERGTLFEEYTGLGQLATNPIIDNIAHSEAPAYNLFGFNELSKDAQGTYRFNVICCFVTERGEMKVVQHDGQHTGTGPGNGRTLTDALKIISDGVVSYNTGEENPINIQVLNWYIVPHKISLARIESRYRESLRVNNSNTSLNVTSEITNYRYIYNLTFTNTNPIYIGNVFQYITLPIMANLPTSKTLPIEFNVCIGSASLSFQIKVYNETIDFTSWFSVDAQQNSETTYYNQFYSTTVLKDIAKFITLGKGAIEGIAGKSFDRFTSYAGNAIESYIDIQNRGKNVASVHGITSGNATMILYSQGYPIANNSFGEQFAVWTQPAINAADLQNEADNFGYELHVERLAELDFNALTWGSYKRAYFKFRACELLPQQSNGAIYASYADQYYRNYVEEVKTEFLQGVHLWYNLQDRNTFKSVL